MSDWSCPYCRQLQVLTTQNFHRFVDDIRVGKVKTGLLRYTGVAIRCLNAKCGKITLNGSLDSLEARDKIDQEHLKVDHNVATWQLLPESSSKPQPDYIPEPIRQDYFEACLIVDKSPKASATLIRRCLQGMIRDFCKISERTLFREISELRARLDRNEAPRGVSHESVDAIDAIRSIGNIGAHMEMDIGVIVDVDPDEAHLLIELTEQLFDEWYVEQHAREERLEKVKAVAAQKKADQQAALNPPEPEGM
jgi:hypothetical protein